MPEQCWPVMWWSFYLVYCIQYNAPLNSSCWNFQCNYCGVGINITCGYWFEAVKYHWLCLIREVCNSYCLMQYLYLLLTVLQTLVNVYSVKWTARLMTGLSSMKVIAMAAVVALGAWYFIDKGILHHLTESYVSSSKYLVNPFIGTFSEDAKHPFATSTTSPSSIALAFYGVMWAYDGW